MQSVVYMTSTGQCFYNIIRAEHGQVLVILKRTLIFGKIGVQMPVAPISLVGSASDEREVLRVALGVGVSARVTSEDIRRYRIPTKLLSDGSGPFVPMGINEIIYNARSGKEMQGSGYRKYRYQVNRILREPTTELRLGKNPDVAPLVRAWEDRYLRTHGEKANQTKLWEVICQAISPDPNAPITCQSLYVGGVCQAVSVLERISEKGYIIVFRIRNFQSRLNDVLTAAHWVDCEQAGGGYKERCYLNIGHADSDGLIAQKESLKPCHHQKVWTLKTTKTNTNLKQYFK